MSDDEKLGVWRRITTMETLEADSFPGVAAGLRDAWYLGSTGEWHKQYREQWRRLIVRVAVAGLIVARPARLSDAQTIRELPMIVKTASSSATVARARLARYVTGASCATAS